MKKKLVIGILALMIFNFFIFGIVLADDMGSLLNYADRDTNLDNEVRAYTIKLIYETMGYLKENGYYKDISVTDFNFSANDREDSVEIIITLKDKDKVILSKLNSLNWGNVIAKGVIKKFYYTTGQSFAPVKKFNEGVKEVIVKKENNSDKMAATASSEKKSKSATAAVIDPKKPEERVMAEKSENKKYWPLGLVGVAFTFMVCFIYGLVARRRGIRASTINYFLYEFFSVICLLFLVGFTLNFFGLINGNEINPETALFITDSFFIAFILVSLCSAVRRDIWRTTNDSRSTVINSIIAFASFFLFFIQLISLISLEQSQHLSSIIIFSASSAIGLLVVSLISFHSVDNNQTNSPAGIQGGEEARRGHLAIPEPGGLPRTPTEESYKQENEALKKKVVVLEEELDRLRGSSPEETENKQEEHNPPRRQLKKFHPI